MIENRNNGLTSVLTPRFIHELEGILVIGADDES